MTVRYDRVEFTVTVGGADVSSYVQLPLSVSYGADMRIGEASIKFRTIPASAANWATVAISMGRTGGTGGTAGNLQRFNGFVFDPTWELWPYTMTIPCKSPLVLADVGKVVQDDYYEAFGPGGSGAPITAAYKANGIDLSTVPIGAGHGLTPGAFWQDADMVRYVLDRCGLSSYYAGDIEIGGIGKYLGTPIQSYKNDTFSWRRGQSGLQWIEDLEKVTLGFRTFDTVSAGIKRQRFSTSQFFNSGLTTLAEATDTLEGSTLTSQLAETANRIVVTGMDYGRLPMVAVAIGPHVSPPPNNSDVTFSFSSPMIELDEPDTVTNYGLSCREVADWLEGEHNQEIFDASIVTWRDDQFEPGQFVYLNAPHLGPTNVLAWAGYGVMQGMWVRRVDTIIAEDGSFSQRLNLRNARYTGQGLMALPASLPWSMGVRL